MLIASVVNVMVYAHGSWLLHTGRSYRSLAAAERPHVLSQASSSTACDTSKFPLTALGLDVWILVNAVAVLADGTPGADVTDRIIGVMQTRYPLTYKFLQARVLS